MRSLASRWFVIAILTCITACFIPGCADEAEYQRQRDAAIQERDAASKTALDAQAAVDKANAAIAELEASKAKIQKDAVDRAKAFDDQVARLQVQINALEAGSAERTKAETLAVELQKLISSQREKADLAASAIDQDIAKSRLAAATASAAAAEAKGKASAIEERVKAADKQASADDSASAAAIGSLIGAVLPGAAALSPVVIGLGYKLSRFSKAIAALKGQVNAAARVVQSLDALAEISPQVQEAISTYAPLLDKVQQPDGKAFVDKAQGRATTSPIS